ncbi:MAG TPA: beta-L-arabinofuranosidase domain-containing protein [Bryobacteraceae bacterium]|nr:beta-L-arabinofuranosidase domain-containing protein [Bryobacteraceae bacterium]
MTRREFVLSSASVAVAGAASRGSSGQGILSLGKSPHAKLKNVPVQAVRMGDGFWAPRRKTNVWTSIPGMLELLEAHGIVDNFRRLSGRKQAARRGPLYTDSDLYKWMEAAAFVLQNGDEPKLRAAFERLTDEIVVVQEPSGYLNTYYQDERKSQRFKEMDRGHELYCLGHMLQAGLAYQRATGDTRLLDSGIKFVDYLTRDFGPEKHPLLTGHPELEMALVELYRTTGDRKHLDLAGYLLRGDGERLKLRPSQLVYMFSGKPFTSRTKVEGHSVRCMYACSGATDYFIETGDQAYWNTLSTLWEDMTRSKMYITGGVGSRSSGEAFGEAYELPNQLAYTETCAAIASMMWQWRMLAATGDAKFTDVLERALYNGVNSGMSLSGSLYCYRNPLEHTGNPEDKIRNPWYDTTCCPPNIQRILASLPGYMYSTAQDGVYVHLYHASDADLGRMRIAQVTDYPWDGRVMLEVKAAQPGEATLHVRIPGWTRSATVQVNGRPAQGTAKPGSYFAIRREWKAGDKVALNFDMTPQFIASNARLSDNAGRAAVERGPLVYCLEGVDQKGFDSIFDAAVNLGAALVPERRPDLLGGVTVLQHAGSVLATPGSKQSLYAPLAKKARRRADLTFIPYYAFHNREMTPMMVWVPYV